jgi:hypothetical protein
VRKEAIVVAALLFALGVTAFLMLWAHHDELVNGEVVNLAAPPLSR